MKPKRVVIVANDVGGVGGMEKHLDELIKRLKRDYLVTVVASTMKLRDNQGVQFIRVPTISRPFPLMITLFSIIASIQLLSFRGSFIHTTGAIVFNRVQLSTVHFCHKGYVNSAGDSRGSQGPLWKKLNSRVSLFIKLLLERVCYQTSRSENLVAVSGRIKRELTESYGYPSSRIQVISNGVDISRFHPVSNSEKRQLRKRHGLPEDGTFLVFMGGDWERKGLVHALTAFDAIAEGYPELHFLVVGTGDVDVFSRYVKSQHAHRVHFVGSQPAPEQWFQLSDMFLFPSSYEACSLAVLEAAASGLAMVITNVGGADDIVEDGVTGFLVDQNSEPIATKLRYLLENSSEVKRLGRAIRKKVEDMTWDHMYQHFKDVYDDYYRSDESKTKSTVRSMGVHHV